MTPTVTKDAPLHTFSVLTCASNKRKNYSRFPAPTLGRVVRTLTLRDVALGWKPRPHVARSKDDLPWLCLSETAATPMRSQPSSGRPSVAHRVVSTSLLFLDFDQKEAPQVPGYDLMAHVKHRLKSAGIEALVQESFSGGGSFHVLVPVEPIPGWTPKSVIRKAHEELAEFVLDDTSLQATVFDRHTWEPARIVFAGFVREDGEPFAYTIYRGRLWRPTVSLDTETPTAGAEDGDRYYSAMTPVERAFADYYAPLAEQDGKDGVTRLWEDHRDALGPCPWHRVGDGWDWGEAVRPTLFPGRRDERLYYVAHPGSSHNPDALGEHWCGYAPKVLMAYSLLATGSGPNLTGEDYSRARKYVLQPALDRFENENPSLVAQYLGFSDTKSGGAVGSSSDQTTGAPSEDEDDAPFQVRYRAYRRDLYDGSLPKTVCEIEMDWLAENTPSLRKVSQFSSTGDVLYDGRIVTSKNTESAGCVPEAELNRMVRRDILGKATGAHRLSKSLTQELVDMAAARSAFNPVTQGLEALEWDGERRLGYLPFPGTEDTEYSREALRSLYITMAVRALHPGISGRTSVVLYGPGMSGKSAAALQLVGARPGYKHSPFAYPVGDENLSMGVLQGRAGASGFDYDDAARQALRNMLAVYNELPAISFGADQRARVSVEGLKDALSTTSFTLRNKGKDGSTTFYRGFTTLFTTNYGGMWKSADGTVEPLSGRGLPPDYALLTRFVPLCMPEVKGTGPLAETVSKFIRPGNLTPMMLLAEAVVEAQALYAQFDGDGDAIDSALWSPVVGRAEWKAAHLDLQWHYSEVRLLRRVLDSHPEGLRFSEWAPSVAELGSETNVNRWYSLVRDHTSTMSLVCRLLGRGFNPEDGIISAA